MNGRAERRARRLGLVGSAERVVYAAAPSPLDIVLRIAGVLVALVVLAVLLVRLGPWAEGLFGGSVGFVLYSAARVASAIAFVLLVWNAVAWAFRFYVLTDRRAVWVSGVFRRLIVECELVDVRQSVMFQPLRQRVFGLGTIGLATAGTDAYEMIWSAVPDPAGVLRVVRETAEAARLRGQGAEPRDQQSQKQSQEKQDQSSTGRGVRVMDDEKSAERLRRSGDGGDKGGRIPVIGLVGGIGAGKSAVASAFAGLGCVVADSDREVRAALDRPEIVREIGSWWGGRVINEDGTVNRREVAAIVFADVEERRRLESLLHPLVHAARVEVIRRASADGARAVIVDAPLLFEAGVDRECDAVVFVEASREVRARRVKESRGWDVDELARRESTQMPIEEKRSRSGYVIVNEGGFDEIRPQAERVLVEVESSVGGRG